MSPYRGVKRTIGYIEEEGDDDNDVPTAKMTKLTVNEAVNNGEGPHNCMQEE